MIKQARLADAIIFFIADLLNYVARHREHACAGILTGRLNSLTTERHGTRFRHRGKTIFYLQNSKRKGHFLKPFFDPWVDELS